MNYTAHYTKYKIWGNTDKREWVQDDPFAFEKLNLLSKLSNYLFKITHALITIIVMLHIYHSSALQNISKYIYVSGQDLWSSKISLRARGGGGLEKNTDKHFLEGWFTPSVIPLFFIFASLYLILLQNTYQIKFHFLTFRSTLSYQLIDVGYRVVLWP